MNSIDSYVGEHFLPQQGTSSRNTWPWDDCMRPDQLGVKATRKNMSQVVACEIEYSLCGVTV